MCRRLAAPHVALSHGSSGCRRLSGPRRRRGGAIIDIRAAAPTMRSVGDPLGEARWPYQGEGHDERRDRIVPNDGIFLIVVVVLLHASRRLAGRQR